MVEMNGGNAGWMFCDKFLEKNIARIIKGFMILKILRSWELRLWKSYPLRDTLKRMEELNVFLRGYIEIC